MLLALTEDQKMLAGMAGEFVAKRAPIARTRQLRHDYRTVAYDPALWLELASLGWIGIPFPERLGGSGLGMAELNIPIEALGRSLAPEPFLSSVLMGGMAIFLSGDGAKASEFLPLLCQGDLTFAFAHEEGPDFRHAGGVELPARPDGDDIVLSGRKLRVLDASTADHFVVSARMTGEDGPILVMVPAEAEGLAVSSTGRVDSRNAGTLTFNAVRVPRSAILGAVGCGEKVIEAVLDRAIAGLCAEMVGLMSALLETTLEYLRTRVQFDVPIGSFQALQHRAAICFIELELARSVTMAAARCIDDGSATASAMVSAAKARCSDAAMLIANEALQMHGGIGMTDECNVGLYLKRAMAASLSLGSASWHRDRFSRLSGF